MYLQTFYYIYTKSFTHQHTSSLHASRSVHNPFQSANLLHCISSQHAFPWRSIGESIKLILFFLFPHVITTAVTYICITRTIDCYKYFYTKLKSSARNLSAQTSKSSKTSTQTHSTTKCSFRIITRIC